MNTKSLTQTIICILLVFGFVSPNHSTLNADLPIVEDVDLQPFSAQIKRVIQAKEYYGIPFSYETVNELQSAFQFSDETKAVQQIQRILDPQCLFGVNINPESRVKVAKGNAKATLVENGWRVYLIKVNNEAGVTAELRAMSPNARRLHGSPKSEIRDRWLDLKMLNSQPLQKELGGLSVEYRLITLYSKDNGKREAKFIFDVGQGTQDLGFRNEVDIFLTVCQREILSCMSTMKTTNPRPLSS